MLRLSIAYAVATALLIGCSQEPATPTQPTPTVPVAGGEQADKNVLIATNPTGAIVILKGAEVGTTPMKLLVRGNTNLVLEKEGYVRQALLITPETDPNLVVDLVAVAAGEEPVEEAEEETEEPASDGSKTAVASKGKSKKKKDGEAGAASDPAPATGPAAEPTPAAAPAPAAPAPKKKSFSNMDQLKAALRDGAITRDEFRKYQGELRARRAKEFASVKQLLADQKIDKREYKERINKIKQKYEHGG